MKNGLFGRLETILLEMASLAVRMSFRWVPDEATGPTDTLVTTSTGQRYVDVRFLKKVENDTGDDLAESTQSPDNI